LSAEFGRNSVIGSLWNFTEAVARPFEGRRMTYGVEFGVFLFRGAKIRRTFGFFQIFWQKNAKNFDYAM
jgi:hypothetical protein